MSEAHEWRILEPIGANDPKYRREAKSVNRASGHSRQWADAAGNLVFEIRPGRRGNGERVISEEDLDLLRTREAEYEIKVDLPCGCGAGGKATSATEEQKREEMRKFLLDRPCAWSSGPLAEKAPEKAELHH